MLRITLGFVLSLAANSALGALYSSPAQLPKKTYDYVVVGSGPGGGVIANRLSEDPNVKVLIIEAGVNPDGDLLATVPWFAPSNLNSIDDWNFTTTSQPGLDGRSIAYARGKALGGSSTLNFMVWTRGSRDDFDRWAKVTGDNGWSWNSLLPYMTKIEKQVSPADGHNPKAQWNVSAHGTTGPLPVTLPGFSIPSDIRVLNASAQLGGQYKYNPDMNTGDTIGIGWSPLTSSGGARASSWTSYIKPYLTRPNLDVLYNTQVTKVLKTGTQSGVPIFKSVQFAQNSTAPAYTLTVSKEIILSAGSVMTPQILQLSGIGDPLALGAVGIPVLVKNLAVGKNLQDHALLTNTYSVQPNMLTLDEVAENSTFLGLATQEWQQSHNNELVLNACNQLGWFRINGSTYKGYADPSAGPTSGHYELIFTDSFVSFSPAAPPPTSGKFFTIFSNVVSPASRGTVTINSKSPWVQPSIDPGLLSSRFDVITMREAIKAAAVFGKAKAFSDFLIKPVGPYANALAAGTDSAIEAYAKSVSTTVWHPTSSVSMTSFNATNGALNPDLTVKGTVGLRVVDASAFPFIPAAHTQAAVYILAERAADIIKKAHP